MINGILAAAIGGAAGGAVVPLLEAGWKKLRKQPTGKRLNFLNILTMVCIFAGVKIAASINEPSMEDQLDQGNPAIASLHRYFPADYKSMVAMIRAQRPGTDVAAIRAKMLPYVSNVIAQHAKKIDDVRARAIFSLVVDESRLLKEKNPESCLALLNGKAPTIDLASIMTPEMQKRDLANTAATLEQIATRPAPPPSPMPKTQAVALTLKAFDRLTRAEQNLVGPIIMSGNQPQNQLAMGAFCNFEIELFTVALAEPPGTLRSLMASS